MAFKKMTKHEILVRYGSKPLSERPEDLRYRAGVEAQQGMGKSAAKELRRRAKIVEEATHQEIFAAQEKDRQENAKARKKKAALVGKVGAHG